MIYQADLAFIHHEGFSEFAESASLGILELMECGGLPPLCRESGGKPPHSIIDIGCGSGVLARELTLAGFDVLGFDASAAMIELARVTAPKARFDVARFAEADIPPCDAIVSTGEVLNYGTFDEVRTFVASAARALKPKGMLLFDIAERDSYPPFDERRVGGESWSVIAIKESDGAQLRRRVLTFREIDGEVQRSEEVHQLELYEREAMLALLREDFKVRVRRSYGSRRLPKGHAVYVCIRR